MKSWRAANKTQEPLNFGTWHGWKTEALRGWKTTPKVGNNIFQIEMNYGSCLILVVKQEFLTISSPKKNGKWTSSYASYFRVNHSGYQGFEP
jgi:hypothetical protein